VTVDIILIVIPLWNLENIFLMKTLAEVVEGLGLKLWLLEITNPYAEENILTIQDFPLKKTE
jgi:hypothetical protein